MRTMMECVEKSREISGLPPKKEERNLVNLNKYIETQIERLGSHPRGIWLRNAWESGAPYWEIAEILGGFGFYPGRNEDMKASKGKIA